MPTVSRAVLRGVALALPLTFACKSESLGPPPAGQATLYWDLHLNHHAVMLSTAAPYDTLTLVATPRNISQEPLAGLPAPTYASEDPERVLVTPEGTLVAVGSTAPGTHVKVTATLTAENLKHTDYVLVRVVDDPTPPVLGTLSVQPIAPDSAKVATFRKRDVPPNYRLTLRASDALGAPMTDLLVSFRSSDTRVASINDTSGRVEGYLPGWVNFYAATTAFGITKADTLRFRIGLPIVSWFGVRARQDGTPGSILEQRELRVGVGAAVVWEASNADATRDLDITFTDPTHVAAFPTAPVYSASMFVAEWCDIFVMIYPPEASDCTGSGSFVLHRFLNSNFDPPRPMVLLGVRTFPIAGTYAFHSTLHGFDGRIVVVDEREE